MTDYFALLDQPRRPWLEADQLKETFHAKTLRSHPDAQSQSDTSSEAAFAELNEAYRVLRDPKRRLHHFLTLENDPPSAQNVSVPKEMEAWFPMVAELIHESDSLVQDISSATNALSRSLLKPRSISTIARLREVLEKLSGSYAQAEAQLRKASEAEVDEPQRSQLHDLYLQFSYLTKWIAELEEKQLRLENSM